MLQRYLALGVLLSGCTGHIAEQSPDSTGVPGGGADAGPGASAGGMSSSPGLAGNAGHAGSLGPPSPDGGNGSSAPAGGGSPGTTAGAGGGAWTDPGADLGVPVAGARLARLTHFQWRNSVQDLLQLEAPTTETEDFTPDAIIGFDTNKDQLRLSGTLREDYERAAEALATQVASDPQALARLIPSDAPTEPTARASAFIQSFGSKAYRRPLTPAEVAQYLSLFQQGPSLAPDLDAFQAGVMLCIRLFLQSPHFLYRTELATAELGGRIALTGHEVAAKLALAVTGSIPDPTLMQAATSGAFDGADRNAVVDAEAQRLLETPRGKAAALHLQTQALAISRYGFVNKDSATHPEFKATTAASLRLSAELFLGALYDENRGIKTLLASPEAFVDENLAPLYGLQGAFGTSFERVDVSSLPRRGILTQPGFLALFSGENQPDPIHRGVFVNQQILCVPLGPPAANIPPLPEPGANETNRQRINALTGPGTCGQGCHATIINPIGFAFENYDPIGKYRTLDGGVSVDASGTYYLDQASVSFSNAQELVELLSTSRAAHRCAASHWLSYLYGRLAVSTDAPALDALAERSNREDLSSKAVIRSLVQSEAFLSRSANVESP